MSETRTRHSAIETYRQLYSRKVKAFRYLYEFTFNACGACVDSGCACKDRICQHVQERAKERGIDLPTTGHRLRFIGERGCVVAPHLRETCTIYLCNPAQNKTGFDRGRYAKIRRICDRIEWRLMELEDEYGRDAFKVQSPPADPRHYTPHCSN